MSAMRKWSAAGLLLVATVVLSAGCDRGLSSNLRIDIRPTRSVYAPDEDFSATLTYTNKSLHRIRETFPSSCQYHIAFYDWLGIIRSYYPDVAFTVVTYLDIEPLGTRVDTLSFPISHYPDKIPAGLYRVRAWVDGHEEIYSEAMICVSLTER